jgi:hypothetical protein
MKTLTVFCLGLLVSVGIAAGAVWAADTSVTGNLEDSFCFLTMGAHGPSHKQCATECAKAGIPVLLVDKSQKYYVLMPNKNAISLPPEIINKMEDEVTVTGQVYDKGGVRLLTVDSVK